jgi:AsmA protein
MRKFLLILLGFVVLLIGVALVAPFVVPTETYTQQIAQQVERATGRQLTISGPVTFSVLPRLAFEAEGVALANPPGAASPQMVRLKTVQVQVKIWPLVHGTLEIDRFVLIEPQIDLEIDAEGRPNWQFGEPAADRPASPPAQPEAGRDATQDGADAGAGQQAGLVSEIKLGDIRIENGALTYTDARSGAAERVDAINMTLALPDLESRMQADGSLDYNGQKVDLALAVDKPSALLKGGSSPVKADVTTTPADVGFDGQVTNGAEPAASGTIDLEVSSIRDLAAWLAKPIDFEGQGLQTLRIAGKLDGAPKRVAFTDATIGLDAIEAKGEFVADLSGEVPKLDGRLDLGAVDLDPYLPPPAEQEAGDQGERPAGKESPSGWSDEPLQLPPLGGANVDFALSLDSLSMREIEVGRTELALQLANATLKTVLKQMALYGGQATGEVEVTAADGVPSIRQQFRLDGLNALPFLEAVAGFNRLEGTVQADTELTSRGGSQLQLVRNLNGNGSVAFTDGAIVGINIAAMVRNAASAFLDPAAGEQRKTDFAELAGTFAIRDGILTNDDLRLQAPVLRVDGRGRVDLPARTVAYRIEPTAAATLEGQGAEKQAAGVLVPVIVEGPWDDLSYRPDLSGALESALRNP